MINGSKMIPYNELIHGKLYYIYQPSTEYLTHDFYRGIFVKQIQFKDVYALKPLEYLGEGNFGKTELYYEVDKIKENSTKAKQNMEKRALDKVLSMILNEDFVWY
jgi:hypothetical protein